MNTNSKNSSSSQSDVLPTSRLFDDWIDPIESGVRARVRDWIEAFLSIRELDTALQRPRYGRSTGVPACMPPSFTCLWQIFHWVDAMVCRALYLCSVLLHSLRMYQRKRAAYAVATRSAAC